MKTRCRLVLLPLMIALLASPGPAAKAQICPNCTAHLSGGGQVSSNCIGSGGGPTLWSNIPPGGSVSDAVAWQYGGLVAPDWGAYAAQYTLIGNVTGLELFLTQDPAHQNYSSGLFDGYVYNDAGGQPGTVLWVQVGMSPGSAPALWPSVSCYNFPLGPVTVSGLFWIGCYPRWSGQPAEWFLAADKSSPGIPMTNFAPGIGYPTGWGPPSLVPSWLAQRQGGGNAITAFGIGVWGTENGTPVNSSSWGSIKSLYR